MPMTQGFGTAEQFVESVGNLPSLPSIVEEVLSAASSNKDNFVQIARLVERDPGLSARVLRAANSAYYSRMSRISSVSMAIARMGTNEFKTLAFSAAFMNTFKDLDTVLDMRAFWKHSLASGMACRLLASPSHLEPSSLGDNPFYVAGMLHHVGILVEAIKEPLLLEEARKQARERGCSLAESERRLFGFDHAEVGAALLKKWRFPDEVCEAALYHLRPDEAPQHQQTVQVVHLSAMLCHELDPTLDSFEGVAPWFSEKAFYDLGWTQDHLPALVRGLGESIRNAGLFGDALMAA
jgi:HD-like signal output (HDOD) protein